jgi:hypothetical protein
MTFKERLNELEVLKINLKVEVLDSISSKVSISEMDTINFGYSGSGPSLLVPVDTGFYNIIAQDVTTTHMFDIDGKEYELSSLPLEFLIEINDTI